jgi:hypothetical protein
LLWLSFEALVRHSNWLPVDNIRQKNIDSLHQKFGRLPRRAWFDGEQTEILSVWIGNGRYVALCSEGGRDT